MTIGRQIKVVKHSNLICEMIHENWAYGMWHRVFLTYRLELLYICLGTANTS